MSLKLSFSALLLGTVLRCRQARRSSSMSSIPIQSTHRPRTSLEFVELYDTSGTSVPLDGYVLVYYNGNGNVVYRAEDLDGLTTRPDGYFIAGSIVRAPNAWCRAIRSRTALTLSRLYLGNASDFPTVAPGQTAVTATNLIDAVVYKTGADVDGVGLDTVLLVSGGVVDEFGRDGLAATGAIDSIGRIPNASGAARALSAGRL